MKPFGGKRTKSGKSKREIQAHWAALCGGLRWRTGARVLQQCAPVSFGAVTACVVALVPDGWHFSRCSTPRPVGRWSKARRGADWCSRLAVSTGRPRGVPASSADGSQAIRKELCPRAERSLIGHVSCLRRSIQSIIRPVLKHGPRSLTCARVIGTVLNLKA